MSFQDARATRVEALAAVTRIADEHRVAIRRSGQEEPPCVGPFDRLIIDAADRVVARIGDGGTSAVVLASALVAEVIRLFAAWEDPTAITDSIRSASAVIADKLRSARRTIRVDDVGKVARTAAGGDERVAALVGAAMQFVGAEGGVRVTAARDDGVSIESVSIVAPVTIRWAPLDSLRDARVLLLDEEPASSIDISDPSVAATVVVSTRPLPATWHVLKTTLVEIEGPRRYQAEVLEDLAAFTGASVGKTYGSVGSASARDGAIRLTCGGGTRQGSHRNTLLKQIAQASRNERDRLYDRIAILDERYATIRIRAAAESEHADLMWRTDRAIVASRAALVGGVVTGGGIALLRACSDADVGSQLLGKAAKTLIARLAAGRGISDTTVLRDVCERGGSFGLDVVRRCIEDLDAACVWDPVETIAAIVASSAEAACSILARDGECVLVRETS